MPEPRIGERGYVTLLRAIVGQQVSVASAAAIWAKLEAATGGAADPANMAQDQRRGPARRRPLPPEDRLCARASPRRCCPAGSISTSCPPTTRRRSPISTAVKGIGRWTAEIYLLFAEGRPDIFPAGDLAVQIEIGSDHGPRRQADREGDPRAGRGLAPHRGAAAVFAWHHRRAGMAAI